jgi:RimJ/RimL family protein N-acetyltransferase
MSRTEVRLRPITEADLPDYVAWLNDPEVTQFLHLEGPVTLEDERKWFASVNSPDCNARNWAIEVDGRHIGNWALRPDESGEIAGFGIVIGDKTQWAKGYGTATLREVLRIGFEEMKLQRIHLTAFAANTRGIRCYEKCGFQHEGVRRRHHLKRGKWCDMVCMGILREEWEAARPGAQVAVEGVSIRSYRPDDYETVVALWREVGFHVDDRDGADALSRHLSLNPGLFLVAEAAGRLVATVIGSWDGRRSLVYRLAVAPDFRGRGLGASLMAEIEGRLQGRGARSALLFTTTENAAALGLYRRLGYSVMSDCFLMFKRLTAAQESDNGPECR